MNIKIHPGDDGLTELWIQGKFVAGYSPIVLSSDVKGIIEAMMREVWQQAVSNTEQPLREAIRRALSSNP